MAGLLCADGTSVVTTGSTHGRPVTGPGRNVPMSWIKWQVGLPEKREVIIIAAKLGIPRHHAAGCLMAVWEWIEGQTEDGLLRCCCAASATQAHHQCAMLSHLDRHADMPGLADAMVEVGWLDLGDGTISIPNFDRHNGQPSKTRALAAERMRKSRSASAGKCCADVAPMLRNQRNTSATREEKRREEKSTRPNTLPTSSATSSKTPSPQPAKPAAASVPVPPPKAPPEPADAPSSLPHIGTIPTCKDGLQVPPKPERPRNEAWELVCKAWSLNPQTKSEKSRVGKLARDYWIKTEGAKDRLRRIEVQKGKYKSHMKGMTLSPEALLKWWDDLRAKPQLDAWGDPLPSADEVEKMLNAIHTQPPPPQYDDSVEDAELAEGIE